MDHAVGAAGQHESSVAVANQFDRLADGLGTGGARGQAVEVWPFQTEMSRQVCRGGVQFLLCFLLGVEGTQAAAFEDRFIQPAFLGPIGLRNERKQIVEVLNAFPSSQVDAKTGAVYLGTLE